MNRHLFWYCWDHGGNVLALLLALALVEAPALWGHRTVSQVIREWAVASWGWIVVVIFQGLALYLFYHFFRGR